MVNHLLYTNPVGNDIKFYVGVLVGYNVELMGVNVGC